VRDDLHELARLEKESHFHAIIMDGEKVATESRRTSRSASDSVLREALSRMRH
jgi:hypothetical protein